MIDNGPINNSEIEIYLSKTSIDKKAFNIFKKIDGNIKVKELYRFMISLKYIL